MNKLEINIDATSLGKSGCILNLFRTVVGSVDADNKATGGYRQSLMGSAMVYGIAFHKYMDTMFKTKGQMDLANKAARESFNIQKISNKKQPWLDSEKHLLTVCYNVWSEWVEPESSYEVLALGDQPATEVTFNPIYYEDDNIIVRLCGTIDTIGKFKNGCFAIRDWKTTSAWDNEGYFQQYELSRQLRIYVTALKWMAKNYPDSLLGKIGATNVGSFIDAIFLKPEANAVKVIRSEVFQHKEETLKAFQLTLDDKLRELSYAVKTRYLPKQGILNGSCEQKYHKCIFWDVCKSSDPVAEVLLQREFIQKTYNPLKFNE